MYFLYLGEVLKRAFTPTPRLTDGLQVAAASALPAVASIAGIKLPASAQSDAFAYIGLAVVSYFVIRLFWAPYSMWKEQVGEIAGLKLELTKPERLVLEHLARIKAKYRAKLSEAFYEIYDYGFKHAIDEQYRGSTHFNKASHLIRVSGIDSKLMQALITLQKASEFRFLNKLDGKYTTDLQCLTSLYEYLNGNITIEVLLHRWPTSTELKIPQ